MGGYQQQQGYQGDGRGQPWQGQIVGQGQITGGNSGQLGGEGY